MGCNHLITFLRPGISWLSVAATPAGAETGACGLSSYTPILRHLRISDKRKNLTDQLTLVNETLLISPAETCFTARSIDLKDALMPWKYA